VPAGCRFVYVLVSATDPQRHYVGLTSDVPRRLAVHNSGGSQQTAQHRPWRLIVSLEFSNRASAIAFEKYLKTGSGRVFAKRHPRLNGRPRASDRRAGRSAPMARHVASARQP
jgi:predicted GIY-YIG superfamily endonuclease